MELVPSKKKFVYDLLFKFNNRKIDVRINDMNTNITQATNNVSSTLENIIIQVIDEATFIC